MNNKYCHESKGSYSKQKYLLLLRITMATTSRHTPIVWKAPDGPRKFISVQPSNYRELHKAYHIVGNRHLTSVDDEEIATELNLRSRATVMRFGGHLDQRHEARNEYLMKGIPFTQLIDKLTLEAWIVNKRIIDKKRKERLTPEQQLHRTRK